MTIPSIIANSGDPMARPVSGYCFHCGAAILPGMAVAHHEGTEVVTFCCHGCHGAWLLITGAGLDAFYRRRDWQTPGLAAEAFGSILDDAGLARYVYAHRDLSAIDIIIDGIRCATCVWLNEKIIGRLPGVREVRVNYATSRARVVFDPAFITPAAIFDRIGALGYVPRPYTVSAAEESADRERKDLLVRFGTAFFLTMQLMAYSFALYAGYFQGITPEIKLYLQLFSLLVTTPVVFYSGLPFLRGSWRGLVNGAPNMELLIAVGALSSYGYSIYATFAGGEVYYETAAMIVTLILAGRLLENVARRRAAGGVERLLGLTAGEAQRVTDTGVEPVDVADLCAGDVVLVAPGERFCVDGTLVDGSTEVDESPATGESLPVAKAAGDPVIAGSINLTGAVKVLCEQPASASFVARVARLVEEAQNRRAPIQGIADRTAARFVPAVMALAFVTCVVHYAVHGTFGGALMTALAVVVIACPCALGLATPTAILAGTGAGAAGGVIFKGGDILERLSRVTVAVFDKTGTLTCGRLAVVCVLPTSGTAVEEVVAQAAAVEAGSLHPIGRALCAYAQAERIEFTVGRELATVAGGGVTGRAAGREVAVGSLHHLAALGVAGLPVSAEPPAGCTEIFVAIDRRLAGSILLQDLIRDDAPNVVEFFARFGIRSILLSGDHLSTVRHTAAAVGIGEAHGGMSPADKAAYVEGLQGRGEMILMVGDGINDAPALSAADVGCAIAGGTDIALETSDLVLARPDLAKLITGYRLARRTMTVVRQNLGWAFVYNIVGIPLAMAGVLTPIYAAGAMAVSSLCVVLNSLRIGGVTRG